MEPLRPFEIDISENARFSFFTSMTWPGDGPSCGMLMPGARSHRTTSRSGCGYGSGLSRSALTTLNTAVFAPIPIASDATITVVRPAVRLKVRSAYRMSCRKSVMATLDARVNLTKSTYRVADVGVEPNQSLEANAIGPPRDMPHTPDPRPETALR